MVITPLDVPSRYQKTFIRNYQAITRGTDKLFLFAADHKIEKLESINPEDFFVIADSKYIGAFATHLGLIARYGNLHRDINYLVKLNGKTDIIPTTQKDPCSRALWSVEQVVALQKRSGLSICGIGYTIYLGSDHEAEMLAEAAQVVYQAHQHGLIATLWVYPRGRALNDETAVHYAAGAAGVATSLGSDFVKIKPPHAGEAISSAELLKQVVKSAGNTKVLCSGGERQPHNTFIKGLHEYINIGGVAGVAVGRNIYEHDFGNAMKTAEAISGIVYEKSTLEQALEIVAR